AYTMLTGASPTVVRAAIMGGLLVVATLAGRPASAATSIALATALMTGWDPLVVEDVSCQLSFAAIAGLVYLSPPLHERGARLLQGWGVEGGVAAFLLENMALTAGAVLATLPLFALYFDRLSLVTFAANLLLVPAFPAVLGASALAAAVGGLWAPLGWPAWAALTYLIETARFFAGLPLASVGIDSFGAGHAAVAFVALGAFGWWLNQRPRAADVEDAGDAKDRFRPHIITPPRQGTWLLGGALAVAAAIAWWAAFGALRGDDGRLAVTVLDVGQGDAILIETPDGRHVLIDGGPDGRRTIAELSEELPFWDRTIDLVALTHAQEDHVAGLVDVLERYDVRKVLTPPLAGDSAAYLAWRDEIDRQAIPAHIARAGDVIDLGDGATLRVLGPTAESLAAGEVNDASLVLKLSWRNVSFLLTGDIEIDGEEALLRSGAAVGAQVLKVAHHGSATSTSPAFLRAVEPAVSVVSVGEGNRYGHPSPSVVERLGETLLLRTDQNGTVRLETDGERLWVDVER
ncbi:MAG: ComEC/Rec2 family competence protein, partial [Chloroflexi bacterium]|nr:ComEC/Rec2 family competence protein [Chloroflexota bacterium]